MIQPLLFTKAGTIQLNKYDNCGKLGNDAESFFRHGDLFSVQPSSSDTTSTVESGNSLYPVTERITAKNDTLVCVFNTLDPEMESFIYSREIKSEANSAMKAINQGIVIPDTSPFAVKLPNTVKTPAEVLAVDVGNSEFTYVSAAISAPKQFSVSADTLTFSSADAGKSVFVTYDWAATTAYVEEVESSEVSAIMQLEHSTEAETELNGQIYNVYMVYDRVKVTEYATPLIGKTPGTRSVTFKILAPRGGMSAVRKKYVPVGDACN